MSEEKRLDPTPAVMNTGETFRAPFPKKWAMTAAFICMTLGLVSCLRPPNLWSITHYLFDYRLGFIKRGLLGELLGLFFGPVFSYWTLAGISFVIFALWLGLFMEFTRRGARCEPRVWLLVALFFISPGFAFLVHSIGYFDHLGLVVLMVCLLLPIRAWAFALRLALCVSMLFVHEGFFFLGFPIAFFDVLLRWPARKRGYGVFLVFWLAVMMILTVWLAGLHLPAKQQAIFNAYLMEKVEDFKIHPNSPRVIFRDGEKNVEATDVYRETTRYRVSFVLGLLFLLPMSVLGAGCSLRLLRRAEPPGLRRKLLMAAMLYASFSPMGMHVWAWDLWRFDCWTITASLLTFIVVVTRSGMTFEALGCPVRVAWTLVAVAVFFSYSDAPLFDGEVRHRPPYNDYMGKFERLIDKDEPFWKIPNP